MKVFLATDGSEYAAKAAALLAEMEALQPMDLTVLTVTYDPDDPTADTVRPWYQEYRKQIDARVQLHFDNIRGLLNKANRSVHMVHLHGTPTHEILQYARENAPDLIVLGAQGHSMLSSLLLGSVSESVAFHAPCSVLVLRPNDVDSQAELHEPRRLLICYDGSDRAEAASKEVALANWSEGTSSQLLTIAKPLETYVGDYPFPATEVADTSLAAKRKAEAFQVSHGAALPNSEVCVVRARHVGNAIVEHAKESKADLIVLGDSGHSPIGRLFLGSTAKYVLRHADCSVWISRLTGSVDAEAAAKKVAEHATA